MALVLRLSLLALTLLVYATAENVEHLRKLASPTGYALVTQCPNVGSPQTAFPLGICIVVLGVTSAQYTATATAVTYNTYGGTTCSGPAVSAPYYTVGSCSDTSPTTVASSISLPTTLPTAPTANGLLTNLYDASSTTCSSPIAWNFYPSSCLAIGSSSAQYSCSGTTVSYTSYATSTTCTGTSTPVAANGFTTYSSCTPIATATAPNPASAFAVAGVTNFQQTCLAAASPPSPPASSPTKSNSCFAGSETLEHESGDIKPISQAKVGDRVLSYSPKTETFAFSNIIAVPHKANDISATFEHISLESGNDIKLTPDHLIYSGTCDAKAQLTYASNVRVGDCLQTVQGREMVVSKTQVQSQGIYTVVTENEMVVVNNVVASPFAWNHAFINTFYSLHRAVSPQMLNSAAFQSIQSFYGTVADFVSSNMQFAL